jgi:hypothetical protein
MTAFVNIVKLRGYLGKDAEVPSSDIVSRYSYGVLSLCIDSGSWNEVENVWTPQTVHHHLICIGPYFCGQTRGLEQGDHIEIDGELCASETGSHVRVLRICRLDRPVGSDEPDDG